MNTNSYWHKIKYLIGRQYSEIQTSRLEVVIGRSVQRLSGSVTVICVKSRALNLELINCARLAIGRYILDYGPRLRSNYKNSDTWRKL